MNRTDLIELISGVAGITLKDARNVAEALEEAVVVHLRDGRDVIISGVGRVRPVAVAARKGRNPKTGDKVELTGKYVPHFKPGKELRERVNIAE